MAEPADRHRAWSSSRAGLAVGVLALVGLIVFVQRPAGDTGATEAPSPAGAVDTGAATTDSTPSGPPTPAFTGEVPVATDRKFCAEFRELAELQGQFVDGDVDEDTLREAARSLVDTGVPAAMSLPARSGYYTLIGGLYDYVGLGLDPAAVGAPAEPVATGDDAFTTYLQQSCPQ